MPMLGCGSLASSPFSPPSWCVSLTQGIFWVCFFFKIIFPSFQSKMEKKISESDSEDKTLEETLKLHWKNWKDFSGDDLKNTESEETEDRLSILQVFFGIVWSAVVVLGAGLKDLCLLGLRWVYQDLETSF